MEPKDNICSAGKWQFNQEVADCFGDMLERSVPDYRSMRSLVFEVGRKFVRPDTAIVDTGCSTGLAVQPFVEAFGAANRFWLIDNAPAMTEACRKRYDVQTNYVFVQRCNLWSFLPLPDRASLVLAVLSLQFMPTSYRQQIMRDIYQSLNPGGAFILVEKVCGGSLDELMTGLFYDMKRRNGYTDKQIMGKRKSLENVLSPLKAEWNVDMLQAAGFRRIEMFWRCLNFCGWVAVK